MTNMPSALALVLALGLAHAYDAVICGENGYAPSSNANLSYNSNAWNPVGNGFQCLSINDDPPSFDATWRWTDDPATVHSYPHVTFSSEHLPVPLENLSSLALNAQWAYSRGNDATSYWRNIGSGLRTAGTVANVAFDMFADLDDDRAQSATMASTEIMIWIGAIGGPWPLGYSLNGSCYHQTLGDANYTLYTGANSHNATVFTWLTAANQTGFFHDVSPLLQYLWRHGLVDPAVRLGLVEFGSEAYHAGANVTLSASNFSMDVGVGVAPLLALDPLSDGCSDTDSAGHRHALPWHLSYSVGLLGACLLALVF